MSEAFESAVQALIDGRRSELLELLDADPSLVRARSERAHRATLLHYLVANGVEEENQRSPANSVLLARDLLGRGADPDALATFHGEEPNSTPLGMLVTSVHPHRAGTQAALVDVLVDGGAAVDGVQGTGNPLAWAVAFGYRAAAEALARRGATPPTVIEAAALGRAEEVGRALGSLARDIAYRPLGRTFEGPEAMRDQAFVAACRHGRLEVAELLLSRGADLAAPGDQGFTALHSAAWYGDWPVLEWLLQRGAPLEAVQDYGGTVLDGTVWAAAHAPVDGVCYPAVVERLLDAGSDPRRVSPLPSGVPAVDAVVMAARGAREGE